MTNHNFNLPYIWQKNHIFWKYAIALSIKRDQIFYCPKISLHDLYLAWSNLWYAKESQILEICNCIELQVLSIIENFRYTCIKFEILALIVNRTLALYNKLRSPTIFSPHSLYFLIFTHRNQSRFKLNHDE